MSLSRALKWSFLSELASKAIQPIVFVILASIVTPEDFGIMAAALMVIAFSQIFWEAGMSKAVIQRQGNEDEAANVGFWINVSLGLCLAILLLFVAKPIALNIFNDERVTLVLQVMSLQILFGSVSSIHSALLQKHLEFKKLFWVRFSTITVPGLVSIPLALNGLGYWALVIGTLAGQAVQVFMLWRISPWAPKYSFNVRLAQEMGRFGIWVGASGLLAWFYLWADSLIVGAYLGNHELGLYRAGNLFVTAVFVLISGAVIPVAYSMFSKIQSDLSKIREGVFVSTKCLAIVLFPLAAGLLLTGDLIASILFSHQWDGIGVIIGLVAITQAAGYTVSTKQEAYRSIGRPDLETKVMLISMLIRLPFYFFSISSGLVVFIVAKFISTLLGVANHLYFSSRFLGISVRSYYDSIKTPLLASLIMLYLGKNFAQIFFNNTTPLLELVGIIFTCSVIYVAIIGVVEKKFILSVFSILVKNK